MPLYDVSIISSTPCTPATRTLQVPSSERRNKYLVMPFSLANALSLFQYYINNTLRDYLNVFCTVYIDDILIYSNFWEEHTAHVKKVLECLWIASLQIDISKCEFNVTEVCYLDMIITTNGICMNP